MLRWPARAAQLTNRLSDKLVSKLLANLTAGSAWSTVSCAHLRPLHLPDLGGKLSKHIKAAIKYLEVSIISRHHELIDCVVC